MSKILITVITLSMLVSCKGKLEKAVYEGKDISETASIIRDKNTKDAELSINIYGKWTLYAGNSADAIDYSKSYEGEGKGIFPLDVNNSNRSYFQLITDEGKAILSERHLPMAGGYNFRDLGGIKTKDGKFVKWGKFLRADELADLTDADLSYLSNIPILSVVDFRTKEEIQLRPDKLPASVKNSYELNISPGNLSTQSIFNNTKLNGDSLMISMNTLFVTDDVIVSQYKKMFEIIQNENNLPLIFHCTAGKDRTGMAAALILFALGADEDVIIKDYLSSNFYLQDKYKSLIEKNPHLKPMFVVKPKYIQTSIDAIKEKYGSVENYLTTVLGVDIPKLRHLYLY